MNPLPQVDISQPMVHFSRVKVSSESTSGMCRLCGQDRRLHESHIIPSFCYKPIRDVKGRLMQLSSVENRDVWGTVGSTGYSERLLCSECEIQFSRYESHAAKLFRLPLPPLVAPSRRIREHKTLDYRLLKLFFLSVLWRSSVAKHEFFRYVSLGPHEPKIRDMLFREEPGPMENYPIMVFMLNYGGEKMLGLLTEPTPMTYEQRKFYRFVMAGSVIMISVSSLLPTHQTRSLALSPKSPVRTYDAELGEFEFLRLIPSRIAAAEAI